MDIIFDYLKQIFNENGFRLYMIGSTSRDYLLNKEIKDYDFVTDATPDEVLKFLHCDTTFKKYGTLKYKYNNFNVDIVTLRKEANYQDFRHPLQIIFIKDINEDYLRRDFTINAIYIDENYNVIDPSNFGVDDLNNRILRLIGNKDERIKEDPLRILRAKRFVLEYNLNIEKETEKAIMDNLTLLEKINKDKIHLEQLKLEKIKNEIWKFESLRFWVPIIRVL